MFLRCRHAAKIRFIKLRSDVLVKLQLLDNKRGKRKLQPKNKMRNCGRRGQGRGYSSAVERSLCMREASGSNPDISTDFLFPFPQPLIFLFLSAVQDVAFQLERLVAGMYIYYRQCHRSLKPAAVFPIEVELGIDLDISRRYYHNEENTVEPQDDPDHKTTSDDSVSQLPPVDDLLLDLGLEESDSNSATPHLLQTSGLEQ